MPKGRIPLPSKLKKTPGSNPREPKPVEGKPVPPAHLDAVARAKFVEVVATLDRLGVLSLSDAEAIELYAATYAAWLDCETHIKAQGKVFVNQSGTPHANPYIGISNLLGKLLASLQTSFGLNPSARTRVNATPRVADDPLSAFLAKSGKGVG